MIASPIASAARRVMRRVPYALVWRNPRGYSLPTHLAAVFAHLRINCVIDVGAHVGEYGRKLRKYGYGGRIVSFEPVAENFERLREARDGNWHAHDLALGSRNDTSEIHVSRDTALSSFLPPAEPFNARWRAVLEIEQRETVEVRTLDSVFDDAVQGLAEPRVFLKLDTQGWDLEVLRGAEECLPRILGLQSEVSVLPIYDGMPGYLDAIRELTDRGFDLSGIYPVSYHGMSVVELDVVLIRSGF